MKKLALAAAVTAAMMSAGAQATLITQTDSFGPATTNWTHALGALNQFDPLLGTLNSVTASLTGSIVQNLSAENLGATPDNLTPLAGGQIIFRFGATNLVLSLPTATGATFAATAFDGIDDKAGGSGFSVTLNASDSVGPTAIANLLPFIGVGTLSGFNTRAIGAGAIQSDNGNLSTVITTQASAALTLVYDYTPVPPSANTPEPGALALLGLGLFGIVAVRRRKTQ